MDTETEFKEGDLVEAVKGDLSIKGRLVKSSHIGGDLDIESAGWSIKGFTRDGFTVTLIERPKPKVELPTEVGVYAQPYKSDRDDEWHTDNLAFFYLNTGGNWADIGWGQPDSTAQFTRLESRADTAKAVIEWFAAVPWGLRVEEYPDVLNSARENFRVTDA